MNRKGFTLIELLAVLVVLGIVLVISIPSITDAYKNSKIKSEEAFVQRLTQTIDSYVKLNSDEIKFTETGTGTKNENGSKYTINYQKGKVEVSKIIKSGILTQKDFINPGNKEKTCEDAQIEVYKDSDFVYCYKVAKDSLGCLTDEYKNKITDNYVINTCAWTEKTE